MKRRAAIKLLFAASAGSALGQKEVGEVAKNKPLFSFGVIADPQYVDAPARGSRFYRESLGKLKSAIDGLNRHDLAFVVTLGDVIDRDFASFAPMMKLYEAAKAPRRFVLGNHDFDVEDAEKAKVPSALGMSSRYFSEVVGAVRFLFLDGTDVSSFAHPKGSDAAKLAAGVAKKFQAEGRKNIRSYNSGIGEQQMAWIKQELTKAEAKKQKVVVFCHLPVMPLGDGHNLWNDIELVKLLEGSPQFVAYMNGHNHRGNYVEHKGRHYLNFKGMVETKTDSAYAVVSVFEDRMEVDGSGVEPDRSLK